MKFSRAWSIPNHETFSIAPIGSFVRRYLAQSKVSIDPFARNKRLATYTNDLDPTTKADSHLDAETFCRKLGKTCDLVLFDPPYSPRQISECYKSPEQDRRGKHAPTVSTVSLITGGKNVQRSLEL
jgi:hypothetical protein